MGKRPYRRAGRALKSLFFVLLLLLVVSCSRQHVSPDYAAQQAGTYAYCSLLHVHRGPYPLTGPKPYLGIMMNSLLSESAAYPACKENRFIEVAGIINGSPAAKAGLQEKDIILSLHETLTCNDEGSIMAAFRRLVEEQIVGSAVRMEILRNDQRLSITVLPEARPVVLQPEAAHPYIGQCQTHQSLLEQQFHDRKVMPVFNKLLDELYVRSNMDHNPGLPPAAKSNPLQLREVTYDMRHPLSAGEAVRELSSRIADAAIDNSRLPAAAASLLDMELPPAKSPAVIDFPALLQTMETAKSNLEKAFSNLSSDERALLRAKAIEPWKDSRWNRILEISTRVDRAAVFKALSPLLSFLTTENLTLLKEDLIKRFGSSSGPVLYQAETGLGLVIVGSSGPNIYSEDAALILDLGGNDLYLNNAGGTRPGMPVALAVDWGGNNQYISRENFSQGAGVLGGGFLLDLGESAAFSSLDGSQGAGFWGVGLLSHLNGRATYRARRYSQGTGQMGIGMLLGGRGNDHYSGLLGGQGLGLFGGTGLLMDRSGDDYYQLGGLEPDFRDPERSTVSMGQGFGKGLRPDKGLEGAPGGIGMLIDQQGDDLYMADYFAQGASYYYGLGLLHDQSGDDQYISGRYSQGAGIHSSIGVLIDESGDDSYYSSFGVAQGLGHDFGIGLLEDRGGANQYWGGTLVQGAATNGSLGMLIDLPGNGRRISAGRGQAFAEGEESLGLMINGSPRSNSAVITIGTKKD